MPYTDTSLDPPSITISIMKNGSTAYSSMIPLSSFTGSTTGVLEFNYTATGALQAI